METCMVDCMKQHEVLHPCHALDIQSEISNTERRQAISWLLELSFNKKQDTRIERTTLHLGVALLNAFLELRAVPLAKLQFCAQTAIFIAAKYEEVDYILASAIVGFHDIRPSSGGHHGVRTSKKQRVESAVKRLHSLEYMMLEALDYKVNILTAAHFAPPFLIACGDIEMKVDSEGSTASLVADFLLDCSVLNLERFHSMLPSKIAAAAVLLSRRLLQLKPLWPDAVRRVSGYTEMDLDAEMRALVIAHHDQYRRCREKEREASILFDVYDRRGCERGSSSQTVVEIIVPTLLQLGQKALLVAGQK